MRALFRPFALHAAYTPIETIVFFCILGTLSYFHLLSVSTTSLVAALRALTVRFSTLARNADSVDIVLVLLGYVLMHTTFYLLVTRSYALGSTLFLPLAILSSAVLALLLALPVAIALRIPIDPVALSEALPFLVCTVGFDKPLRLARAVFHHPHLQVPPSQAPKTTPHPSSGYPILVVPKQPSAPEESSSSSHLLKPAPKIITESLSYVYKPIIRDYILEIAVLTVGAYSRVGGLKEVCALAALILAVDCLLICTYLAAILGVMVEVRRIETLRHQKKQTKSYSPPSSASSTSTTATTTILKPSPLSPKPSFYKRLATTTFDLKVHFTLFGRKFKLGFGNSASSKENQENPVARLKLLLITSFLILHILNFITPLTPSNNKHSHHSHSHHHHSRKLDLSSPGPFLNALLLMLALSVLLNGYLLRGIAAGFVGGVGGGDPTTTTMTTTREVRFSDGAEEKKQSVSTQTLVMEAGTTIPIIVPPTPKRKLSLLITTTTSAAIRPLSTLLTLFNSATRPLAPFLSTLNDEELILLVQDGKVAVYDLERVLSSGIELSSSSLGDEDEAAKLKAEALERAVRLRRALISRASRTQTLEKSDIPLANYDYSRVLGACCENVVGYIPLPLGIAGPLTVDDESYPIPMATAEGTLVASTSRGCKALNQCGGVTTVVTSDGMTRAPAVEFPNVQEAARAKRWIESEEGWNALRGAFESTSRFAKLVGVKAVLAGRTMFVRFKTETGDAMGMNMISKGSEKALERMMTGGGGGGSDDEGFFPTMKILALSGNYCTDKKPAAVNWIEGRGKSVVAEAVVRGEVVKKVLKTTVAEMVRLGVKKNLVGSAMAGSIGGFNAHAANILTAMFLATGQDPAQNVESSQCMTLFEALPGSSSSSAEPDLLVTVTMPCIEVGTVGGGTVLGPQQSVLEMLGLKGAHRTHPGQNAQRLARVIAAAVMAGELSLMAALASGELVRAHMRHNRSGAVTPAVAAPAPPPTTTTLVEGKKREMEVERLVVPPPPMLLTPASSTCSTFLPPFNLKK